MASLTHVCMWTNHGWKRVTAAEISRVHPGGGVSARSGIFMCELCGQYVTLTSGNIRDPYFKHSASEKIKDCPERTFAPYSQISFTENDHGLPIRIRLISSTSFELELGLLPVPQGILGKLSEGSITIKPQNAKEFVYSYTRINREAITYVSLGNVPATSYRLSPTGNIDQLRDFWPSVVDGIDDDGAIFDIKTGRKLPYDADVEVGKSYYLLKRWNIWRNYNSVTTKQVCISRSGWSNWYIYEVKAEKFDGEAACFFLDYHCRLTEQPVSIYPLWPCCVEAPYLIYHKDDKVNMFFQGDATPKTFPYTYITEKGDKNGSILTINCSGRQQLLSAGRSKILEYTYLWKDPLDYNGYIPEISVIDFHGKPFDKQISTEIPERGLLRIHAPFDGGIVIEEQGKLDVHYSLHADQSFLLDGILLGQTIRILQGNDIVWCCTFQREEIHSDYSKLDYELYTKLKGCHGNYIKVPHSMGALYSQMSNYPKCRKWLYEMIKSGKIPEKGLKIIKSVFRGERDVR